MKNVIGIPKRLCTPQARFFPLKLGGTKEAKEPKYGWVNYHLDNNLPYDSSRLLQWSLKGYNIGLVTGRDDIVVIDADSPEILRILKKQFPETLVITSSEPHKQHWYYRCHELAQNTSISLDIGNKNVGHIKAKNAYIVIPPSIHPSGVKYKVVKDVPIAEVPVELVRHAFDKYMKKPKPLLAESHMQAYRIGSSSLPISQVLNLKLLTSKGKGEYQGSHPVHGSSGLQNFTVNVDKNLWHCFRHNTGGDAFTWIAVLEGLIDCADCIPGTKKLGAIKFNKVLRIASEKYNFKLGGLFKLGSEEEEQLREQVKRELGQRGGIAPASQTLVTALTKTYYLDALESEKDLTDIWIYQDGIRVPRGRSLIKRFVYLITDKEYSQQLVNRVLLKIEAGRMVSREDFFKTEPVELVPVKNGIVNMETGKLLPFTPDRCFFQKLTFDFDPAATCPNFDNHLDTVLENSKKRKKTFWQMLAWILKREYAPESIIVFEGKGGRNGKGKTLATLNAFVGVDNATGYSVNELTTDRFCLAELHLKLANFCGDVTENVVSSIQTLLTLSGRDKFTAPKKHLQKGITFENYAKFLIALNEFPHIKGKAAGFWDRIEIFKFPYRFVEPEVFAALDSELKKTHRIKDPEIVKKLTTPAELSGMLNKAIEAWSKLKKNRGFTRYLTPEQTERYWRRKSNSFLAFAQDHIVENTRLWVTKPDMRAAYYVYCRKHGGLKTLSEKVQKRTLEENFPTVEVQKVIGKDVETGKQIRERVWVSITLKNIDFFEVVESEHNDSSADQSVGEIKKVGLDKYGVD